MSTNIKGLLEGHLHASLHTPRGYPKAAGRKCPTNIKGLLEGYRPWLLQKTLELLQGCCFVGLLNLTEPSAWLLEHDGAKQVAADCEGLFFAKHEHGD